MKSVLVIGLGRFGRHVVRKLDELGDQIMAVDAREERVQAVLSYVTSGQIGDSTDIDFLKSLGIPNFDVCIVGIGDDFQSSLETTSLLKELGAKHVVSRASRDRHAKFLLRNGADEVVYPERQMANWTALRCSADHILDYVELDAEYGVFEMDVPACWRGKSLIDLDLRKKYRVNVMAFRKNGIWNMNVAPQEIIDGQGSVLILGRKKDIFSISKL